MLPEFRNFPEAFSEAPVCDQYWWAVVTLCGGRLRPKEPLDTVAFPINDIFRLLVVRCTIIELTPEIF